MTMTKTKKPFRILITGSRSWTNEEVMHLILKKCWDSLGDQASHALLVNGMAQGADQMAARIWRKFGGQVENHAVKPTDWARYGPSAGYRRNAVMVDLGADICFAFIRDKSRGATHTAELAERAGIKTLRVVNMEKK